jgi:hypothetical protein
MQITWTNQVGVTEASDAGLPPGTWPARIVAPGPDGVFHAFQRLAMRGTGHDVECGLYGYQKMVLTTLND